MGKREYVEISWFELITLTLCIGVLIVVAASTYGMTLLFWDMVVAGLVIYRVEKRPRIRKPLSQADHS